METFRHFGELKVDEMDTDEAGANAFDFGLGGMGIGASGNTNANGGGAGQGLQFDFGGTNGYGGEMLAGEGMDTVSDGLKSGENQGL
jgi:hypothetical protein